MPPFRPSVRQLYLLALFQLLGGPLVILAVVFGSRLVVTHVAEHGVRAGVAAAWKSAEWEKVAHALTGAVPDAPASKPGKPVPPVKDDGGKLFGECWVNIPLPVTNVTAETDPTLWQMPRLPLWAHAPPAPPPRCL